MSDGGTRGIWIVPISDDDYAPAVTLVLVALVFGLVNGTLGRVVRFVSIPLYIITFGLFGLIVNGLMFALVAWLSELVAWLSELAGFGLRIETFWWGVLAALVMSVLAGLMNALLGTGKKRPRR
ncbi:phage holin family protein [Leucobacter sp. HY1910]